MTTRKYSILLFALLGLAVQQGQQAAAQQQQEEEEDEEEEEEEEEGMMPIQSCLDLGTAVREAAINTNTTLLGTAAAFDLANNITCDGYITIASGQDVTIRTGTGSTRTTITITSDFVANSTSQSLLDVQAGGILTLDGINFVQEESFSSSSELLPADGVRAIYNKGALTVTNCGFDGLAAVDLLPQGGAVSLESGQILLAHKRIVPGTR